MTPPAGDPAARVNVRVSDAPAVEAGGPEGEQLAGANARILATLIDFVVFTGLYIMLNFVLSSFLAWILAGGYLLFRDSLPFLDGQSIGKKAMKLRALSAAGDPLTGNWAAGAIRNAALLIPLFPLVELVILLTREDGQDHGRRLGDEWAKTKVVVIPPPVAEEVVG